MDTSLSSRNIGILNNIFQSGILPGKILIENSSTQPLFSYDTEENHFVSFNCITKIDGIRAALFHTAKGAFSIALERHADLLPQQRFSENQDKMVEALQRYVQQNHLQQADPTTQEALCEAIETSVLSADPSLQCSLSKRALQSAMLVFEFSFDDEQIARGDFCEEKKTKFIAKDRIKYIILSKSQFESCLHSLSFPREKIIFVESKRSTEVKYSPYPGKIIPISQMEIPDYEAGLNEVIRREQITNENLPKRPLCTHVVRLQTDEDEEKSVSDGEIFDSEEE